MDSLFFKLTYSAEPIINLFWLSKLVQVYQPMQNNFTKLYTNWNSVSQVLF